MNLLFSEGTTSQELEAAMQQFKVGEEGEVRFYVNTQLSPEDILKLQSELISSGITPISIVQDDTILSIKFKKTATGIGSVWSNMWSYIQAPFQIFKAAISIPWWVWGLGAVGIVYLILRSEKGRAAVVGTAKAGAQVAGTGVRAAITKGANPSRRKYREHR